MEEVPRRTSLVPPAFPCFALCLIRVEAEGLLDYEGRAGIISIVWWNLRPVIFGVEQCAVTMQRAATWIGLFGYVIAQACCSQKSFREITLNYAKLP